MSERAVWSRSDVRVESRWRRGVRPGGDEAGLRGATRLGVGGVEATAAAGGLGRRDQVPAGAYQGRRRSETRHRAPGARDHLQRLGLREGQADALLGQVFAASRAEPGGDA